MKNNKAIEIFKDFLRRGKYRITPERFEVLEAALQHEGHFGADDLYVKMKNTKSVISRATVYNTLELLAQCELISKRNFGDNMTRFESNFKRQTHDHLICVDCGRIIEFTDPRIKKIPQEICDNFDFEFHSYSFNIFGRCKNKKDCLNKK